MSDLVVCVVNNHSRETSAKTSGNTSVDGEATTKNECFAEPYCRRKTTLENSIDSSSKLVVLN